MTREEAIDILKHDISADKQGIVYCHDEVGIEALEMAIKALEQNESAEEWYKLFVEKLEQEPKCRDCVSRDYLLSIANKDGAYGYISAHEIINAPSVNPQEPCEDAISKTEVREFVEYIQSIKDKHNDEGSPINYGTICDLVIRGWELLDNIQESNSEDKSEDKESAQITAEYNAKAESFYDFFKFTSSI